ncbi:hypothetical protein Tco_0449409 [Tanacetum coccineum]
MKRRGDSSKRRPKQNNNNLNDENWSYRPLQQHQHHINSSINHQQQKDQPCSSSSLYPKVAPNLTVPTLLVLNNQESGSLNYAGKDETNKDKEVCLSDDLNASKEDCVEYEYEDEHEHEDDDDVVNKLEKLRLCGEEADLSDDVFKDNDQLQQDEVNQ